MPASVLVVKLQIAVTERSGCLAALEASYAVDYYAVVKIFDTLRLSTAICDRRLSGLSVSPNALANGDLSGQSGVADLSGIPATEVDLAGWRS